MLEYYLIVFFAARGLLIMKTERISRIEFENATFDTGQYRFDAFEMNSFAMHN